MAGSRDLRRPRAIGPRQGEKWVSLALAIEEDGQRLQAQGYGQAAEKFRKAAELIGSVGRDIRAGYRP
jgi:hypothetical protein